MRAVATLAAWSIAASAGCFYFDPINQRPALDIRQTSSESVFRNQLVTLEAVASDPEGHVVAFQWRVYACTDAVMFRDCDADPHFTGIEPEATFRVPPFRADPDGDGPEVAPPVESLRVVLEGHDEYGATARPPQELIIVVENQRPTLELRVASTHGTVIGTPIDVYARYGDDDDTPARVTLEWTAFSPSQLPDTLVEIPVPPYGNPRYQQQGRRFTPQVTGNWDIRVTATDALGERASENLIVTVEPDGPPCLDAWEPEATVQPSPVTEPTLFHVVQVDDDLDAFPRTSSAIFLGETEFTWSMRVGAGPRVALTNPVSFLAFDPQAYAPGTIIELRVEIYDRNRTPIGCADAAQTCSVISQPSCIQRQTWHVEAR